MKWAAYLLQLVSYWLSAPRKLRRILEVAERVLEGERWWISADEGALGPEYAMEAAADWLVEVIGLPIHPNDRDV